MRSGSPVLFFSGGWGLKIHVFSSSVARWQLSGLLSYASLSLLTSVESNTCLSERDGRTPPPPHRVAWKPLTSPMKWACQGFPLRDILRTQESDTGKASSAAPMPTASVIS